MSSSISPEPDHGSLAAVEHVLAQTRDVLGVMPTVDLLSDLDRAAATYLREQWVSIPNEVRFHIVQAMVEDAEENVIHDYKRVMLIALEDPVPDVRLAALEGLTEYDSPDFLDYILDRVEGEPDERSRAALTDAMGRFALQFEADEAGLDAASRLRSTLLRLHSSDASLEVRRKALESLGYLADDPEIIEAIEHAYSSGNFQLRVSSIHAMGHQATKRWMTICHEELQSDEPEIRVEAVTAAGLIGDERSVPHVIDMLSDDDDEVRSAAIVALGSIGGQLAVNTLRRLTKEDDPTVAEVAEEALEEALLHANPVRPLF
jgi:HEAT repeat protein